MTEDNQQLAHAQAPAEVALRLHRHHRGKMQMTPRCPIQGVDDFARLV